MNNQYTRDTLYAQLAPGPGLEELFANEIVNATRRLELCTAMEAESKPQPAIDRTRASAMRMLSHSLAELKKLQKDRHSTNDRFSPDAKILTAPRKPLLNPRVVLTPQTGKAISPAAPAKQPQTARNAACPCGSGDKYKRCCGTSAPPLLMAA